MERLMQVIFRRHGRSWISPILGLATVAILLFTGLASPVNSAALMKESPINSGIGLPRPVTNRPHLTPFGPDAASPEKKLPRSKMGGIRTRNAKSAVDTWNTISDLPTPRIDMQVIADAYGNIYTFGGRTQDGQVTNLVEVYEVSTGEWYCSFGDFAAGCTGQIFPPLPTARASMAVAAAWDNSHFFLVGGLNAANQVVDTVEVYSVYEKSWYCSLGDSACQVGQQVLFPLPTARAFAAGATGPDGGVYIFGGVDSSGAVSAAVEAWDPFTKLWYPMPDLPTPRSAAGAATDPLTQGIFLVGGIADPQTLAPVDTVEVYDVFTASWFCSQAVSGCSSGYTPTPLPTPRSDLALAAGLDGKLYAVGGAQQLQVLDTVEYFDPVVNLWSTGEVLPTPRAALVAIASIDGSQLYVLGGQMSVDPASAIAPVNTYTAPPPDIPNVDIVQQQAYPSTYLPFSQAFLTLADRYEGQPTNTIFGNYTRQDVDLTMPGYGPEVQMARTYISVYPRRGRFGWGWNSTFEMSLIDASATVQVIHHDGRIDSFTKQNGALIPPTGSVDELVRHDDGTHTLTTRQHMAYHFDGQGRLTNVTDADGNTVTLEYNGQQLTTIQDASGRRWTLAYNAQGLVSQVVNPAGQSVSYAYNSLDELETVTDPAGGVMTYVYDDFGYHQLLSVWDANENLIVANWYEGNIDSNTGQWYGWIVQQQDSRSLDEEDRRYHEFYYFGGSTAYVDPTGAVSLSLYDSNYQLWYKLDPQGDVRQFDYDGGVLVASETDGNGGVTRYTYDGRGNMLTIEDPLGHTTHMAYDARDNLISQIDPLGNETTWLYDERDHLISMTDAEGGVTTYTYDARGLRTRVTDPLDNTTRFEYDAHGNQTAIIDPLGRATRFTYYATGLVETERDPLGRITTTAYDPRNLPLSMTAPDGSITRYSYDAVGNRLTVTDPRGNVTTATYDKANDRVAQTDPLGNITRFTYDKAGRQISRTLPDGGVWTTGYDANGRKEWQASPLCNQNTFCASDPNLYCAINPTDCHATFFSYDANGNVNRAINAADQTTTYTYDANNRLIAVEDALGQTTRYDYDAAGNRTAMIDANGNQTRYAYDRLHRQISETNPLGHTRTTVYDALGRITSTTNGEGQQVQRTYDALSQLLAITAPDINIQFSYDVVGNRLSMTDDLGTTTYSYNVMDRLIKLSGPEGDIIYGYDLAGNRIRLQQPGAEILYSYDARNQLAGMQYGGATQITYSYDDTGRVTSQQNPNGVTTARSYDLAGRLIGLTTSGPSGELQRIAYTLDLLGNRIAENATGFVATYTYDDLSQLTGATIDFTLNNPAPPSFTERTWLPIMSSNAASARSSQTNAMGLDNNSINGQRNTYAYSYDAVGNRTSLVFNGTSTSYSYDAANRLTAAGSHPVSYDAAGRLTHDGLNQYTYDALDRLTAIGGSVTAAFHYNGDHQRVRETDQGTTHTYLIDPAGPLPVRIAMTTYNNVERYLYGLEQVLQVTAGGAQRYIHTDGLGNIRLRTDDTGTILDTSAYAPTGERLTGTGSFGFTGEPYVAEGLLVHLRARDYSPALGRFLTMDPFPPDETAPRMFHPYLYGLNNPVNNTDHTGLSCGTSLADQCVVDLINNFISLSLQVLLLTFQQPQSVPQTPSLGNGFNGSPNFGGQPTTPTVNNGMPGLIQTTLAAQNNVSFPMSLGQALQGPTVDDVAKRIFKEIDDRFPGDPTGHFNVNALFQGQTAITAGQHITGSWERNRVHRNSLY